MITTSAKLDNAPQIRFVSSNPFKINEAKGILGERGFEVIPVDQKIEEIQSSDTGILVRDKLLKAFNLVGRPLFVEHTGLYINRINGLPGGLTQVFWDKLEAELFSAILGEGPHTAAHAITTIAYCDGKKLHNFEGQIQGRIVEKPRGPREFQWDCIFQPNGQGLTFAEMGSKKNELSMRRIAIDKLARHLEAKR